MEGTTPEPIRVMSAPLGPSLDGVLAEHGAERFLVLSESLTLRQAGAFLVQFFGREPSGVWMHI
jgi:hypothetical protein